MALIKPILLELPAVILILYSDFSSPAASPAPAAPTAATATGALHLRQNLYF